MNVTSLRKKIVNAINPPLTIGGLEITDTFLRFLSFKDGQPKTALTRLAPGILEDGQIKDFSAFSAALNDLHFQIGGAREHVNIILTIGTTRIYSQVFSLPTLIPEKTEDAVKLNLQMISPVDVNLAYYDAQFVGRGPTGETDYLGTFVDKTLIDGILQALASARFTVVAIEFPALSIARAFRQRGVGYDFSKPYFVFNIYGDGIDFMIVRGGNLYFHYFSSWLGVIALTEERQISFAAFESFLKKEISRVMNFYTAKWGGKITEAVAVPQGLPPEVKDIFVRQADLHVSELTLSGLASLPAQWVPALGAALRGEMPRLKDALISLAPVGTEAAFSENRILHFIKLWRNIFAAVFLFFFIAFLSVDSIAASLGVSLARDLRAQGETNLGEVGVLRDQASSFNRLLDLALIAKQASFNWSPVVNSIYEAAGAGVKLRRVYARSDSGGSVIISGDASSETAAIDFKQRLVKNLEDLGIAVRDVTLPFSSITKNVAGGISFQLSFTLVVK